jgi:L-iditol 2-dehydrogenase
MMEAAILYGPGDLRIESLPGTPLQDGEVRVDVGVALTCGTDLKVFRRGYHARMLHPPCRFGHEFAGTIREASPQARDLGWTEGDRVVAANSAPCGQCRRCQGGQENLCEDLLFLNGAYATEVIVPRRIVERNLLRLQPTTPWKAAALTEPLACVVLGLEELEVRRGERLLVLGAGPIGLMAVLLARAMGLEVGVVGRGEQRLGVARELGATWVGSVGPTGGSPDSSPDDAVRHLTDAGLLDREWDAVFEAVGQPRTWSWAVDWVRTGGRVNWFGGCPSGTTVPVDTTRVHYAGLTLRASFHHRPSTIRQALSWIESGHVPVTRLVTDDVPLAALPEVFRAMAEGQSAVKRGVLMRPAGDSGLS